MAVDKAALVRVAHAQHVHLANGRGRLGKRPHGNRVAVGANEHGRAVLGIGGQLLQGLAHPRGQVGLARLHGVPYRQPVEDVAHQLGSCRR